MKKLLILLIIGGFLNGCVTERSYSDPTKPREAKKRQKEIQRELNSPKFD